MDNDKKIFTEVIKRQITLLGPQITLERVRRVPGIQVDQNGDVISLTGDSQVLLQQLINQFVELSGLIVKKTMESILAAHPNDMVVIGQAPVIQMAQAFSVQAIPSVQPAQTATAPAAQPTSSPASSVDKDSQSANNKPINPDLAGASRDIEDLNKMLNTG